MDFLFFCTGTRHPVHQKHDFHTTHITRMGLFIKQEYSIHNNYAPHHFGFYLRQLYETLLWKAVLTRDKCPRPKYINIWIYKAFQITFCFPNPHNFSPCWNIGGTWKISTRTPQIMVVSKLNFCKGCLLKLTFNTTFCGVEGEFLPSTPQFVVFE